MVYDHKNLKAAEIEDTSACLTDLKINLKKVCSCKRKIILVYIIKIMRSFLKESFRDAAMYLGGFS